jgi:hypothetical protein
MFTPQPCHEQSPMYQEALSLFRLLLDAAQTDSRRLNDALLHGGLKLLQHSAAAATAQTAGARSRSLRYAQTTAANLYAAIDATWCSGQLSDEHRRRLRHHLYLTLTIGSSGEEDGLHDIVEAFEAEPPTEKVGVLEEMPPPEWRGPNGPVDRASSVSTAGEPAIPTALIETPESS